MKILTREEMATVDRTAIEEWGMEGLVLMENAAIGVVDALGEDLPNAVSATVFCGPGNNGGDGLAIARHLDIRGYRVLVVLAGWSRNSSPDASRQYDICARQGLEMLRLEPGEEVPDPTRFAADVWVDALFGTGLSRPLEGFFADMATSLGEGDTPVVAVDLPSGLDASTGELIGPSARAAITVTFAAPKWAHVFSPAADLCGQVVVTDLGMPPAILDESVVGLSLSTAEELSGYLIERPAEAHKGDFGHALVVAGSPGKVGAAILATQAAVAAGAGLVTVGVPADLMPTLECASLESMSLALSSGVTGGLDLHAAEQVLAASSDRDVLALGPGLGLEQETVKAVRRIAESCESPLILDADALNALVGHSEIVSGRSEPTVLTPHPGEAARLGDCSVEEVERDRVGFSRRLAARWRSVVVLKGHQTLVATPDGSLHVNTTGNPGMASGGSGDVLTGILAALIAQGYDVEYAAVLGVFLHGLAGDQALERRGSEGLRAGDLIEELPAAFEILRTA